METSADKQSTTIDDQLELKFQSLLLHVVNSTATVQSQQRGDEDMSVSEKVRILTELFNQKPVIFLERYHHVLQVEHLECFSHFSGVYEIEFYRKEVIKRTNLKTSNVQRKNRRYEAVKKLESEGDYFSDEQMRSRDPLMYEHYIGQYLTDEERAQMKKEIDRSDLKLSTILTEFMDEADIKLLLQRQKEEEEIVEEDSETDSEMEEEEEDINEYIPWIPSTSASANPYNGMEATAPKRQVKHIPDEEKELLRQEFRHLMQERFLKGKDTHFDYSQVDDNVEYDSLDIRGRDEEESYFDEEEPSEAVDFSESDNTSMVNDKHERTRGIHVDEKGRYHHEEEPCDALDLPEIGDLVLKDQL